MVVITGGASGIGRDISFRLAALGSHLIVFDLHEDRLKNLGELISAPIFPMISGEERRTET